MQSHERSDYYIILMEKITCVLQKWHEEEKRKKRLQKDQLLEGLQLDDLQERQLLGGDVKSSTFFIIQNL